MGNKIGRKRTSRRPYHFKELKVKTDQSSRPNLEKDHALKLNLETVRGYIALDVAGFRGNRDQVIVREACGNVYHDIMRRNNNMTPSCWESGLVYMSKDFHEQWRLNKNAKKIIEHSTPMSVIKSNLKEIHDLNSIYRYLEREFKVVWVTPEEDKRLSKAGYGGNTPINGKSRYEEVGIEVIIEPVRFKSTKTPRIKS